MQKPQYAILRFAKYKGPEIGHIEAHNERTKEKYASNPDVDTSRSHLNYHLVQPERKYRAEAEHQIAEAKCRTRKDSVRVVEALVTASPEFFKGKKKVEVRAFFEEALRFIEKHQSKETIISAVVHMDEKTPHMHLSFVPLTPDKRLSAKDIVGNKRKLIWWQDAFWKHMVRKWPDLERGESASETGRTHIPPRLFKEAAHLNRQRDMILKLLGEVNPLNAKKKSVEIETLLEKYIPGVERMQTQMRKYDAGYKSLKAENAGLKKQVDSSKESIKRRLEVSQQLQELEDLLRMLNDIQDNKDGVEYVLVFKLSRFGRNAADVLNSLQLMQDFGVNLICVEDGIDSSKDSGKLMISVLSAVAEIERENIRTQTMAGREQKAREGKWNGGFAPYGYRLENGEMLIAEDEVEVIRAIFDRYIHTNDGVSGVAKYLNSRGYTKKLRQNGTIPGFSASFVKAVLDNPVYMGKIAYGRRRTEKKLGTRNEMHVVEQSEFPVYEGQHEAIISEEDWNLAHEKRKKNAYRREKVNDPEHAHILSGILKCPCCGKSLYGNISKAHSKDKKTRYYYYCKNTVTPTGHSCTFRVNIEQSEINDMIAAIISAMVNNLRFSEAIQEKIGSAVDTVDMEKQLGTLQGQLRQTLGTKSRLERQMDSLDVSDPYYDRKILDLQRRYDEQYSKVEEIEIQIIEVQTQIRSIRQEKISGDNIYRLLLAFDQVYAAASEVERKEFMRAFIERIELFPEKRKDGCWIRNIVFNFPVPLNGEEVTELPLENETTIETIILLQKENS